MSELDKADSTPAKCSPSRPCNRFRVCARCARRRQAKIADAVSNLESRIGQLRWHILYPLAPGADALRAVRADWLRAAQPEGAIWTVEQSRKTGALHCNIITPAGSNHEPANAHHWNQTITGDVRAVGAYIAKQRQMPSPAAYSGKIYGTAGQLWHILANQRQYPAVAAAAAQYAIDSLAMLDQTIAHLKPNSKRSIAEHNAHFDRLKNTNPQTKDDFRAIAARWLPDLLDWKEQNRPRSQLEIARDFMNREKGD